MTIDDYIGNFLRDAQYRIGVISVEMNELEDEGSYQYKELDKSRLALGAFMDILYEGKWLVQDGYNHLQIGSSGQTWSEYDLMSEIDYLRYNHAMNEVPAITFTGHYPTIASIISGGGASSAISSLPAGQYGQLMGFDGNEVPEAQDIDRYGGHRDNETITDYFSGRL